MCPVYLRGCFCSWRSSVWTLNVGFCTAAGCLPVGPPTFEEKVVFCLCSEVSAADWNTNKDRRV